MKKFKNIGALRSTKQQLQKRSAELEEIIRYDWREIKRTAVSDTVAAGKTFLLNKLAGSVRKYFRKEQE